MKILAYTLLLVLIGFNKSAASDDYKPGDSLFVWAKSGLNMRSGPGKNFSIIKAIPFGEKIKVEKLTDHAYNVTLISTLRPNYEEKVAPLIIEGKWVKVSISQDLHGYVIDQYLLSVDTKLLEKTDYYEMFLKVLSVDTTYTNPNKNPENEKEEKYCLRAYHPNGISTHRCYGGDESGLSYTFPGFTIEEVLIFFSAIHEDFRGFSVSRNRENEVSLRGDEICDWSIVKNGNEVVVMIECSC